MSPLSRLNKQVDSTLSLKVAVEFFRANGSQHEASPERAYDTIVARDF